MSEHSLNLSHNRKKPSKKAANWTVPPLDWAAGHGPLTGTLSATTGCAATALLGAVGGMPEGWPLAIGAAGALGHGVGASIKRKLTGRSITTRAASWLLAGGWTTWAMTTGPLTWAAAGSLTALGVGIGAMAANAAVHEEAAEEERLSADARELAREMNAERTALATEWQERIARVTRIPVTVFAVELWASGAGYSLAAELPAGGATWNQLAKYARSLATDARLPLGCAIGIEEGDKQGRVVFDIPTQNVMAGDYPYPSDYSPLSILTGIPWGLLPHSDPVTVFLREACALILGPPGSGKSTFLDAVLTGFARCTDVLTWVIDFNAGGVGHTWVRPWLEAQGLTTPEEGTATPSAETRPGVDWLASTPQEAQRMLRAALAINDARKKQYQRLMTRQDTTLLPVSADIPQIMIVVDEGAELLSRASFNDKVMKQVQKDVKTVMRTTRAMGLRMVLTAVDGNVSAIGDTEVKKFSPVAVALTSAEIQETNVAKLFGNVAIDTSQLNAKGSGVIRAATAEGFPATAFKGWKTSPSMVREAVLNTSRLRPVLDEVSVTAAGEDYTERWSPHRAGWLWEHEGPAPNAPEQQAGSGHASPAAADSGTLNLSYKQHDEDDEEEALAARFRKQLDATFGTADEPDRERGQDRPGLNLSYKQEPPQPAARDDEAEQEDGAPSAGPEWLPAALDAIESAGAMGMKGAAIADMVNRSRVTVRNTLQAAVNRGELVYRDNGPHSVYVHPDHASE